jgi:S1-C subfamily serine protease
MKRGLLPLTWFVLQFILSSAYGEQTPEEILKAVVKIKAVVPKEAATAGSLGTEREGHGVLIDTDGHILTTGYLIVEAETIEIIGPDGQAISANFVGYDHKSGFGLLRAEKPLLVDPIKLGHSSTVQEGDRVLVAGYGGKEAVIVATVVARREFAGSWEYLLDDAIYTAPPYASFGGAALIGRDGRLLGIGSLFTQLGVRGVGAIPCNVFIPIDLLGPILAELKTTGQAEPASKPWMGINAEEAHGRVFVTQVRANGPNEKSGLRPGDLILTVKGKEVQDLADFYRKVWAVGQAGVDLPVSILRGIRVLEITLRSGNRTDYLRLRPKKLL